MKSPRDLLEDECRRLGYEPEEADTDGDLQSIINARRPKAA